MRTVTQPGSSIWIDTVVPSIRSAWTVHGRRLLVIAVVAMGVAAVGRLSYALPYLVEDIAPWAGIDFKNRYFEVSRWFSGLPLYGVVANGDYPPASYAMLWPLLGWLELTSARWLWAASTIAVIALMSYLTVNVLHPQTRKVVHPQTSNAAHPQTRNSVHPQTRNAAHPLTREQRIFAAILICSIYPTQMTIFVGQSGLHVLALLMAGLVVLNRADGRIRHDLLASLLLVLALVKPTLSVPFFWIVLFVPRRLRPMALVAAAYVVLTIFASLFQDEGVIGLIQGWLTQAGGQVSTLEGTANIHKLLAMAGLDAWMLPSSMLLLILLGLWTFAKRDADVWLLAGVAALVARFWIHHRLYDDLLILLPMIALFRLAAAGPTRNGSDVAAGLLLAATWVTMHIPTWAFYDLPRLFIVLIEAVQVAVWLAVLVFLVLHASRRWAPTPIPSNTTDY